MGDYGLGCGGPAAGLPPAVPHWSVDPGDVLHHEPAGVMSVCMDLVTYVVLLLGSSILKSTKILNRFLNSESVHCYQSWGSLVVCSPGEEHEGHRVGHHEDGEEVGGRQLARREGADSAAWKGDLLSF